MRIRRTAQAAAIAISFVFVLWSPPSPRKPRQNDPAAMAVACNRTRLTEVRVCLGKDLSFHDCAAIARGTCKRDKIVMPAVRGE